MFSPLQNAELYTTLLQISPSISIVIQNTHQKIQATNQQNMYKNSTKPISNQTEMKGIKNYCINIVFFVSNLTQSLIIPFTKQNKILG